MVGVNVYYETLSYVIVEEQPAITVAQLVGSIGGQAHICLGLSALGLLYLLQLAVFAGRSCARAATTKSKQKYKVERKAAAASATVVDKRSSSSNNNESAMREHIMGLRVDAVGNIIRTKSIVAKVSSTTQVCVKPVILLIYFNYFELT